MIAASADGGVDSEQRIRRLLTLPGQLSLQHARQLGTRHAILASQVGHTGPKPFTTRQARADLRRALEAGEPVDEIVDAFIVPLVEQAFPEWRTTLDALLSLPGIGGPVGYEGMTAIGIRLAVVEPRISAAVFFAGGFVPGTLVEAARQVTIPLQFLLQWDDEGMERQPVLDLFDAFGTKEKTLHANLGGHAGVPWFEVDDAARFFTRHLK